MRHVMVVLLALTVFSAPGAGQTPQAAAVTVYEGDDPTCTATRYTQGATFVDPGGDYVHLIRNEGTVPASTIALQVIPAGAPRRIDRPDPGNCHF